MQEDSAPGIWQRIPPLKRPTLCQIAQRTAAHSGTSNAVLSARVGAVEIPTTATLEDLAINHQQWGQVEMLAQHAGRVTRACAHDSLPAPLTVY